MTESRLPAEPRAEEDADLVLRTDAKAAIEAARALLAAPVFERQIPIALLTKLASDDKVPVRERRRAAEVLANLQVKLIAMVGELTGTKEHRLRELGIDAAPQEVNLTQVNNRIEIIREGAADWRDVGNE